MTEISTRRQHAEPDAEPGDEEYSRPPVVALTPNEAWDIFDELARKELGMTAEDFERAWKAGEFVGREEEDGVLSVYMLRTSRPN